MSDTEQSGLYSKYEVRKDGEPVEDCFVLEPENDPAARVALSAYAGHTDDEDLKQDLLDWLVSILRSNEDRSVGAATEHEGASN